MPVVEKFKFYDSISLLSPTGQKASNLKEFISILEQAEDKVVFYHLYHSHLRFHMEVREFPNDFANWAAYELEDLALAEKLANFDPYDYKTVLEAKENLVEILEEHMYNLHAVPWARPGSEFFFASATTIIMPLGLEVSTLKELREALNIIPNSSLYFHFHEARQKKKIKKHDDFSTWIEKNFDKDELVKSIRDIDFYFFSLDESRQKLIELLDKELG